MNLIPIVPPVGSEPRGSIPTISFTYKCGRISFLSGTAELLQLKAGYYLRFLTDTDTNKIYFALCSSTEPGAVLLKPCGKGLQGNRSAIVNQIMDMVGCKTTARFRVARKPTDGIFYEIITE